MTQDQDTNDSKIHFELTDEEKVVVDAISKRMDKERLTFSLRDRAAFLDCVQSELTHLA